MNFFTLALQLLIELLRTLLIEELSDRVRGRAGRLLYKIRGQSRQKKLDIDARIHLRVRERLIHKLRTGERQNL